MRLKIQCNRGSSRFIGYEIAVVINYVRLRIPGTPGWRRHCGCNFKVLSKKLFALFSVKKSKLLSNTQVKMKIIKTSICFPNYKVQWAVLVTLQVKSGSSSYNFAPIQQGCWENLIMFFFGYWATILDYDSAVLKKVKFMFSKKATKIDEIFTVNLT